jgi:hypothetical protein
MAAIDACEAAERLGLRPEDRARPTGSGASVSDVLTSAWTYPENVQYAVIRARHAVADDAPYRPELSRPLLAVAGVCAELVGTTRLDARSRSAAGGAELSIRQQVEGLAAWYHDQMVPQLRAAAADRVMTDEGQSVSPAP